ncbi:hypothetical protein ACIBTW_07675 [Micromonospora parva]|uniref:hypothetical protein n=1 Tax=Micromonospora parva TaxID=1464048 RepID=UPI0037B3608C
MQTGLDAANQTEALMIDLRWVIILLLMGIVFFLVRRDERWSAPVAAAVSVGGLLFLFFSLG